MNKKFIKTIAFIGQRGIPKDFIGTSGVEYYVEKKALWYASHGYIVYVYKRHWIHIPNVTMWHKKNIFIITLPTINTIYLDALIHSILATFHACFIQRTDIIWYQGCGPGITMLLPLMLHKRIWLTVHSLDWMRKKWGFIPSHLLSLSEKLTIPFAQKLLTPSYRVQSYIEQTYKKHAMLDRVCPKKNNIKTIPWEKIQKKYGIKKNGYLLYLGRFVPEKRVEWLLKSYESFFSNSSIKLILAGGSSHADRYEQYLRSYAVRNHNILFLGYIFGDEKAELLAHCNAFILPSETEGYPIALLEALSYHRPCIVPNFLKYERLPSQYLCTFFQSSNYNDFQKKLRHVLSSLS